MRNKRWIALTLTASWVLGLGLSAHIQNAAAGEEPNASEPAAQSENPDLITPPPPIPRQLTAPKVELVTESDANSIPKFPGNGSVKLMPAPDSPVPLKAIEQDVWVSPPTATDTSGHPSTLKKEAEGKIKPPTDGYVSEGMITFPIQPPVNAPAFKQAAPTKPTAAPTEMSPYRISTTANKPAAPVAKPDSSSASPYPVIVPAAAKASTPSSIWGNYNKQQPPKQTATPMTNRRDQPAVIQGYKPSQEAPAPSAVTPMPETTKVTAAQLQQRVIVTCGPQAQKVNLLAQQNGSWVVEVVVRSTKDADEVSSKVLGLSEMLSAKAALKIVVKP